MPESLQLRLFGPIDRPALVYLPGLHGDWSLIGGFRDALKERVRFVEMTYPRTLTWSLGDYAVAITEALKKDGVFKGWLLAESFGSQIAWAMAEQNQFETRGIILAGGFVRHPSRWGARLAEQVAGEVPLKWLVSLLFGYARIKRFQYRRSPEVQKALVEFLERRTELDRQAAKHRLHLVAHNNPCAIAQETKVPIYGLTGLLDPVVPWYWVRQWLRRNCPALRDYKIILQAEHNVLSSAPRASAEQVLQWMGCS